MISSPRDTPRRPETGKFRGEFHEEFLREDKKKKTEQTGDGCFPLGETFEPVLRFRIN